MLKIGHRGAKGHAPENTLISFQKALDMGVDGIELDVHLSADDQIMVIHDATVYRTTNSDGVVNLLPLQELKALRIDNEHPIPTLEEVLDLVNQKLFINIELKGNLTSKPVVALIEKYVGEKNWRYDSFLISSFDWNALREVHLLNSEISLGILTQTDLPLAIAFAKFIKAKAIHPQYHLLTKENVLQMQTDGFQVFPWTVNEPEDIQKIKTFEVNGIITDFPERL
jgi:glycerophosphoryl diester phosphodiesterase